MKYQDLHKLPEDERIEVIVRSLHVSTRRIGVALDDEDDKVERYKRKILARVPTATFEVHTLSPGAILLTCSKRPR